ncbi:MAG: MFS transporter, partial [Planctomycetota bacterium]
MAWDVFRARSLPYMTRRNYVYEAAHLLPWGVMVGMAEGNVSAVVVAKTFGGGELLISIAVATTMFAKLVSLVWGMLCIGRRKLRVLTVFGAATVMCIASVAATPQSSWGGWVFVGQMAAAQVFLAGVVTVRSALWKSNYPKSFRGQITARLQLMRLVPSVAAMTAAALLFDRDAAAYRFVYPLVAVCGAAAIVVLQRVRVRGEHAELRRASNGEEADLGNGLAEPFSLATMLSPGGVLGEMRRVLREDRRFARYCGSLMLAGSGNLMVAPVLAAIMTQELALSYVVSIGLLDVLPRSVMMVALFRWAPFFDRVGVVRFRVFSGLCWLSFLVLGTVATMVVVGQARIGPAAPVVAVFIYGLSRIAMGMGLGGGTLA